MPWFDLRGQVMAEELEQNHVVQFVAGRARLSVEEEEQYLESDAEIEEAVELAEQKIRH